MSAAEHEPSLPPPDSTGERPPFIAIALLSAAALAYEVLLTRLFSITLWNHFAYLIISAALLGYGASGTFLALTRERLEPRFGAVFVAFACAFGLTAAASFLVAQRIPFNPLELFWDPRQTGYLLGIYLALIVPFFCAASCVGLAFSRFRERIGHIYSADILGAGAGSAAIVLALFALPPMQALKLLCAIGFLAAAIAVLETRVRPRILFAALTAAAIIVAVAPAGDWMQLRPSPYKDLSQTLQASGARVIAERNSPLAQTTVVESPLVPFRHAPGMSLASPMEPAPQLGVFSDGDGPSPLTRFDGNLAPLAYLDYLTSALPYHLKKNPQVLVLGAGAGGDVLQALYHRASRVDAVELNPQVVALIRGEFAQYSGRLYDRPEVKVHLAEARGFVAASRDQYDLIQVALMDSFGAASAGLYSLSENYLYTTEAFEDYFARLKSDGILAVTRWVTLPPRDTLKLFAAAVAALEHSGAAHPAKRLVLIRGWKTSTLLVKNGEFSAQEIAAVREFCRTRSFDPAHYDGITADEVNRYNRLDAPYFFAGAQALLSPQRDAFMDGYKFHITPASDDRPYFFRFLKWQSLAEILALREQGGLPLLEWGYPVLVATLIQAVLASALFILLPLRRLNANRAAGHTIARWRVAVYFSAIGFGFMFLELAFIQKFILFLAHPLYAVAVVLCAFLVFAGLGSRFSHGILLAFGRLPGRPLVWLGIAIGMLAIGYVLFLPIVFHEFVGLPDGFKIGISIALIAPLASLLGVPFPVTLSRVAAHSAALIPWAWAVNGCASVTGAVLATLLAMHLGFTVVVILAAMFYCLAVTVAPD
jgi:spermidine synthase